MPQQAASDLNEEAVQAVSALLKVIIKEPNVPYYGAGSSCQGTSGSFAAQAIRDLMAAPWIREAVEAAAKK